MRVGDLIGTFLDHLVVERGVSDHTLSAYRRDLGRYRGFLHSVGVDTVTGVTPALVSDFMVSLRSGVPASDGEGWQRPPLADASVARAVVAVRGLHRFALDEGVAAENPAEKVRPPNAARRLPKALSVAQVQRLLETPPADTAVGLRDIALLEVLYGTGTRISEAVSLDVDDVSPLLTKPGPAAKEQAETSALRVLGKGDKERMVPLGRYAKEALGTYLVRSRPQLMAGGRGSPALFVNTRGNRMSRTSAWNMVRTVAERAQIQAEVSPHTLRHCFATHLLEGGADVRVVQELLGHASVTTTQIYTLVTVDHLREVYLTSHPRAY